ncbi:UNVERIFIED_ORG: putative GNAT family acetyltransferase [Arthrobacter sp. UYCu721]
MLVAGNLIGKAAYKEHDGGGSPQRIFYHTVISEEYGGQGLAGKLAKVALTETVDEGRAIVPVCPSIKKYLGKHPEYAAATVAVRSAHLEFLNAALSARA